MNVRDRVASRFLYLKLSMSLEDAKKTLGFPPNANPSDSEISKAYKQKAFENHPDVGGDLEKMVSVNKAKAILDGKDRPSGGSPSYDDYEPPSNYKPEPRPKPKPVVVSFDDAKQTAGIPTAEWKFKTQTAHSGYGDTSAAGFVVCGKDGEQWVFAVVEHYSTANAFTGESVDVWWMDYKKYSGEIRDVAPKAIRELWEKFPHLSKGYNAKVEILSEGAILSSKMMFSSGRAVAFKDAMDLMGELGDTDPWKDRKLSVTMVLNSEIFRGDGTELPDRKKTIELIVNGREFKLQPESVSFIVKNRLIDAIFGTYAYWSGDKKVLTKAKLGKKILDGLALKLTHEPQQLRDVLSAAASQMK